MPAWVDKYYHEIMLVAMFVEILLMSGLVFLELLMYMRMK